MKKKYIIIMIPIMIMLITCLSAWFILKRAAKKEQAENSVLKQDAAANIMDLSGRVSGKISRFCGAGGNMILACFSEEEMIEYFYYAGDGQSCELKPFYSAAIWEESVLTFYPKGERRLIL